MGPEAECLTRGRDAPECRKLSERGALAFEGGLAASESLPFLVDDSFRKKCSVAL